MRAAGLAKGLCLALAACGEGEIEVEGYEALSGHVERNRVGSASDQWIEMHNMMGEWEQIGLIFGHVDDYEECAKIIAALTEALL